MNVRLARIRIEELKIKRDEYKVIVQGHQIKINQLKKSVIEYEKKEKVKNILNNYNKQPGYNEWLINTQEMKEYIENLLQEFMINQIKKIHPDGLNIDYINDLIKEDILPYRSKRIFFILNRRVKGLTLTKIAKELKISTLSSTEHKILNLIFGAYHPRTFRTYKQKKQNLTDEEIK